MLKDGRPLLRLKIHRFRLPVTSVAFRLRCTDSLRGLPAPKVLDLTLSCLTGMGIGPLLAGNPSARRSVALLTPYSPG